MGNPTFQTSHVEDELDLGSGTTSRETIDLPNAHPISRIYIRQRATHASSIDITQDKIEVLLDSSPILAGLSGADVRKLTKFDTGRDFDDPSAGADVVVEQVLHFGRFPRDPQFALPSPLFENPQLRLESTLTATPVIHELSVVVEELLGVNSNGLVMRKRSLVNTYSPSASQQVDTKLPRGNELGAIYVDYADVDNVDGGLVQLGINNFTVRTFNMRRTAIEALNRQTYPFDDDALPSTIFALDYDLLGDVRAALTTRGLSDLKLRTNAASSGVSGTVRVIAEEYIPVSKA